MTTIRVEQLPPVATGGLGFSATVRAGLRTAWTGLRKDPYAMTGVLIYLFFGLVALFAPLIAPYDPLNPVADSNGIWLSNRTPSAQFLLGTTNLGRDIFSQVVYGTRAALLAGFMAALGVMVLGTLVGLFAGYYGGWVDTILMRFTDVAFGIPFLPFVIVLVAFLQPSLWNTVLAMVLLLWRDTGRVIRSQVLVVRERGFIEAARISGAGNLRIIFLYIAPNVLPLSFLYGSLAIGWAILTEASVSFLGFGDPRMISWGFILQDAFLSQAMARGAYYWFVPPGICIVLAVMAGFFIGRGYEEWQFPRLRER